jgi:dTDP-4-dehydrorhamnose reductase
MSTKTKVLIVGGNGFVGSSLAKELVKHFQVFCTYRRSYTPIKNVYYLPLPQLSEKDRCDRFIRSIEPDVVIYCLGTNNEIEAEKEPKHAHSIHSGGITHLMHSTDMSKAKFIYISSDYVFSGIDGNFGESDPTVPALQLGKAKAGAENLLKSRSLNHIIIRCAPLLGRGTLDHPSWLDHIREKIIHESKVSMSSRYIHNPVHVSFLAEVVKNAIERDIRNKILHVGGLTKISFFEFAKRFVEEIGLSPELVESSDTVAVTSPIDYSLNFSETLNLVEAKPLLLEQSFDLFK